MYPLLVADTVTSPGALTFQESWTLAALCITIGGTTSPHAFMNVSIVLVLPCSNATCWNILIFFAATTLISFGTFWMPVSSPDQIWLGDVIWHFCFTSASSLNQFPITVGFAPIARAIDKFCAFLTQIPGLRLRNPLNHFLPAVWDSLLNPVMPLILAYWKANWHTWLIVRGNPLSWKSFMVVAKAVSSAGRKIKQHLDLQKYVPWTCTVLHLYVTWTYMYW